MPEASSRSSISACLRRAGTCAALVLQRPAHVDEDGSGWGRVVQCLSGWRGERTGGRENDDERCEA